MEAAVGKVLGRLTDGWWAQIHDYVAVGEKSHTRGHLTAAASLYSPQAAELETVALGREVLARLHELYFGSVESDPLTALKRAAAELVAEFMDLELVAVALVEGVIYVVVVGKGGVWAKVDSREGWLVNPNRVTGDTSALSGWAKERQVLVAGNSRFWHVLSLGAVRAAVANATSSPEVAEDLGTVVHGSEAGVGGVGVVLQISSPTRFVPRPAGPIFVHHADLAQSRRRNLWLGVGFLALLLFLVGGWRWVERSRQIKQSQQNERIEQLVHKFSQAQALVGLNPVRSRQLLAEVEVEIQRYKEAKKKDERIRQIEANFGTVLGAATGVRQAVAAEVLDLGWLREGMTGARLGWVEGKLVVLDTVASRLVIVDPSKKSGIVIAGADHLGQAKLLAVYPGKVTTVSDKGVVECNLAGDCRAAANLPGETGELVDMDMFAGNIYLLSTTEIWRFQVTDAGYGSAQQWLASSEDSASLSLSSSMAIDGFIWVMVKDGQIHKYNRGVRENFTTLDLDKPFAPGSIVYTDSEAGKLYVLDRGNGRVVVLDKTGAYQLQYQLDLAREAADIVVDEMGGKFYLLAGSKIWQVGL